MQTVGLIEEVKIIGEKTVSTLALFDTGANRTSVDIELASKAGLGPITRMGRVKNPSIKKKISRPVVKARLEIAGKMFDAEVNIQDRSHMNFPVIIGRDILA